MSDFECQGCGACCRQPGYVYLLQGEAEALAQYLCHDIYFFTDTYCELLNRQHLVLRKHSDEACVFLEEGKCSVYEARPAQCRAFPLGWKTERSLNYCKGLNPAS